MRPGPNKSSGWLGVLPGLVLVLAGCNNIPGLDRALLADRNSATHRDDLSTHYFVHCPDVLSIQVTGRPDCSGVRQVGSDGRIQLDDGISIRVAGSIASDVAAAAASQLGVPAESVHIRVAEYNSQRLYVFGEVSGLQQSVAYEGPETVLDLLQRVGGITTGAAPAKCR